jgi:hypothetical protein
MQRKVVRFQVELIKDWGQANMRFFGIQPRHFSYIPHMTWT